MKILITGNAGSGKSTLSKKVASDYNLPIYSLDSIVWQSGWKKTPKEVRHKQIVELIQKDEWVIDGVDYDIQDVADVVVFLDAPRRIRYWRSAKRNLPYLFRSRPELPAHCPEILIIPTLIKII